MLLKKGQWLIFIFNFVYLLCSAIYFLSKENYEFVMYVGVIIFLFGLIIITNKQVNYPNGVLWLLTGWGVLHMLGGGLRIGDSVLYGKMIYTFSETYRILKFDQVVHAFGFGVATLLAWILLKPLLKINPKKWFALSLIVVMAGLGFGALNEIIEFFAVVIMPETGVEGYINSSLDLVFNLIGAIIAMSYIIFKKGEI